MLYIFVELFETIFRVLFKRPKIYIFVELFETIFRVLFKRPKMLFTNPLLIFLLKTLNHTYYYF